MSRGAEDSARCSPDSPNAKNWQGVTITSQISLTLFKGMLDLNNTASETFL